MSKQLNSGRYVLKINSSRLRNSDWDMKISLNEARENEELITLGDSQLLRFIRRLTDIDYSEEEISEVKQKIKQLKKEKNSKKVKNEIIELYNLLDKMLYIEDYIGVVFDNKADFDRATGKYGFKINGKKFKRLLATTGGVKANTVMFCSEDYGFVVVSDNDELKIGTVGDFDESQFTVLDPEEKVTLSN